MRIGLDFDNTIVCYDELFRELALSEAGVPHAALTSKAHIRAYLLSQGRPEEWTRLQGLVYGLRMAEAVPFDGVAPFLCECRAAGIPVVVVSHKTQYPAVGPRWDLHAAAWRWLADRMLFDGSHRLIEAVYFEPTREAKLERISALRCTHFVDDLEDVLLDPRFPAERTERILFDPHAGARETQEVSRNRREPPEGKAREDLRPRNTQSISQGVGGPATQRSGGAAGLWTPLQSLPSVGSFRELGARFGWSSAA